MKISNRAWRVVNVVMRASGILLPLWIICFFVYLPVSRATESEPASFPQEAIGAVDTAVLPIIPPTASTCHLFPPAATQINELLPYSGEERPAWAAPLPFTLRQPIGTGFDFANSVVAADVDHDGDLDVVGSARGDNEITWWENVNGDGSTWSTHLVQSGYDAGGLVVADLDGDGDLDLAAGNYDGDRIDWWENNDGTALSWTQHVIITGFDRPTRLHALDFDLDGDLDLLTAARGAGSSEVIWLENDGNLNPTFTRRSIQQNYVTAAGVAAADLDGDGDPDVMATTAGNNDLVSCWLNCGGQFSLTSTNTISGPVAEGAVDDLLRVTVTHNGRSGDHDLELATLELLFTDAGTPLTSNLANALVENLFIYRDDGSGDFDAGMDTLVTAVPTLTLTNGRQTVAFPNDDPNVQVTHGSPVTYFVALEIGAQAYQALPDLTITHVTDSTTPPLSTALDRDADIPLTLACTPNVSATLSITERVNLSLSLTKEVTPATALPGQPVTYTLAFNNSGNVTIPHSTITDLVPSVITQLAFTGTLPLTFTGMSPNGTALPVPASYTTTPPLKITAFDADALDQFGRSVASDNDILVVGAAWDDDTATDAGAVYVYARQCDGSWQFVKKLTASDGASASHFGRALSLDQDTLIVGAPAADAPADDSGAAYIFMRHHGGTDNWGEVAKLTAADGASRDFFGWSVGVDGDTAVVGARWHDGNGFNKGAAYVFQQNHGGSNNWGQVTKITASDAADQDVFGVAVAIHQDTIVAGAQGPIPTSRPGKAYVFERDPGSPTTWNERKILTAGDGAADDHFGNAVAIDGDTILVGAIDHEDTGSNTGAAYLFARNQGGLNNWGETAKLTASDAQNEDHFGRQVVIRDDVVLITAFNGDGQSMDSGTVYVFTRAQGSVDYWVETAKLAAPDGEPIDYFGAGPLGIAINEGLFIVGAFGDDDACPTDPNCDSGSVYVFDRTTPITDATPLAWQLPPLAPGAGGIITITGIVHPRLVTDTVAMNTAVFATNFLTPTLVTDTAPLTITVPRLALAQNLAPVPETIGTASVPVTLNVPNPYADVTVCYETQPGTATPLLDYLPVSGTLTLPAGTTQANIAIPIVNDMLVEGEETLFVHLSNLCGAHLLSPVTTTLRIVDDDPPQLALHKAVTPVTAQPGRLITYTLAFTNENSISLPQATITDRLPAVITQPAFASTLPVTPTGSLPFAWQLPPLAPGTGGIITITGVIHPDLITDTVVTNVAVFATTFVTSTLVSDTAVLTVTVPPPPAFHLHLPLVTRPQNGPAFPLHIGNEIPARTAAFAGEVFFTTTVQIPATLPQTGSFFLSAAPDALTPVVVDDRLVVSHDDTLLYQHLFSTATTPPVSATLPLSRSLMTLIAGETITVSYHDEFAVLVGASPIWIIWVPE